MPPSGLPYATVGVPGRDMGLKLLLDREADGTGVVIVIPYRIVGTAADGQPIEELYQAVDLHRGDSKVSQGLDLSIGLADFGEFTLLIAKRDPGQGLVWVAFGLLIAGHHDHVLPSAPPRLDPARARWTPRDRLALGPLRRRRA